MAIAIANAAAGQKPMTTTTPKPASHRAPPLSTSTSTKGVENKSAIAVTHKRDRGNAHPEKMIGQLRRRGHDEVEVGAGVKHPRHQLDRLRQHQRPGQKNGTM